MFSESRVVPCGWKTGGHDRAHRRFFAILRKKKSALKPVNHKEDYMFITLGKDLVPIVYGARWATGPVWTDAENLAPTGIRSPYRPVRSEKVYGLSYPSPHGLCVCVYIYILWAGRSGIESRWGRDFPSVQTGPRAHPAFCTMGTGSFPGVKCGWGVLLTTHPLLVPRS